MSYPYRIDRRIEALLENNTDPETDELQIDPSAIDALGLENIALVEQLALSSRNDEAEAGAIDEAMKDLRKRRKAAENRIRAKRQYMAFLLQGQKLKTALVSISCRNAAELVITDRPALLEWANNQENWRMFCSYDTRLKEGAIKEALEAGAEIPGASLMKYDTVTIR